MGYNLEIEALVSYKHKLEAEIERLRSENSRLILTQIERDRLKDEIERLTKELEAQYEHNADLDREIGRLRAVLEWVASHPEGGKSISEYCQAVLIGADRATADEQNAPNTSYRPPVSAERPFGLSGMTREEYAEWKKNQ